MTLFGEDHNPLGALLAVGLCGGVAFQTWSQYQMKKNQFNLARAGQCWTARLILIP